jgi:nicotinamide riboside kinase
MQRTIQVTQLERELEARSAARRSAVPMILSDRSAIDPLAYAVVTAANEEDARQRKRILINTPGFQTALQYYKEGVFVLFKPVSEWLVDDGVRSMDDRGQNLDVFRGILRELGIPFIELGEEIKDLQSRVAFVKGFLDGENTFLLE